MSKNLFILVIVVVFILILITGYGIYYSKTSFERITTEQQIAKRETADEINRLTEEGKSIQKTTENINQSIESIRQSIENTNLGVRVVSGLVDRDGKIRRGTGFFASKDLTGCDYKIVFNPPFQNAPIVVASIDDAEKPAGFIRVVHFTDNIVEITTMKDFNPKYGGGACDNRGFSFIAAGSP